MYSFSFLIEIDDNTFNRIHFKQHHYDNLNEKEETIADYLFHCPLLIRMV